MLRQPKVVRDYLVAPSLRSWASRNDVKGRQSRRGAISKQLKAGQVPAIFIDGEDGNGA
jgi:hypothetical protein